MRDYFLKLSVVILSFMGLLVLSPALAQAASCNPPATTADAIACGANDSAGVPGAGAPVTDLNTTITKVINLMSVAVGLAAVVMIIIAGFRYVTSGGSDEKVKSAKNTLIYAVIGLVIVALAQVIVKFVLDKAIN